MLKSLQKNTESQVVPDLMSLCSGYPEQRTEKASETLTRTSIERQMRKTSKNR